MIAYAFHSSAWNIELGGAVANVILSCTVKLTTNLGYMGLYVKNKHTHTHTRNF